MFTLITGYELTSILFVAGDMSLFYTGAGVTNDAIYDYSSCSTHYHSPWIFTS